MRCFGLTCKFKNIKDYTKMTLWLPELMLKLILMWPEYDIKYVRSAYMTSLAVTIFIQWGLLSYFYENRRDFNKCLNVFYIFASQVQVSAKMILLLYHYDTLKIVIKDVYEIFWPCKFLPHLKNEFRSSYNIIFYKTVALTITASIYNLGLAGLPLLADGRELPYSSVFPFDYTVTPIYEIIFFVHSVVALYMVPLIILSFDFLFVGLCANLVTQYKILKIFFLEFGKPGVVHLNSKLNNLGNKRHYKKGNENQVFLTSLIKHHELLLRTIRRVENTFNLIAAIQLWCNIVGICISGFMSRQDNINSMEVINMGSYLMGSLIQLYLYCASGNDLLYEASDLSDYIFGSDWYELRDIQLQKDLVIALKHAQVPAKMTAVKVFPLDYSTFFNVVQLSFSFYTLLTSIIE